MNKADAALSELLSIEKLLKTDSPLRRMAPACKLFLAVSYILITMSFSKYDFFGLLPMLLPPLIGYQFAQISPGTCFVKLKLILPLVCVVGIFNPFFDTEPIARIGSIAVSGGVVSMVTLMMKGCYCLMVSFLLAATTSIEEICGTLQRLHCPKMLTSLLLLTYRYVSLFLEEVSVMTTAYSLRAPGQRGIHYKAWGSFLGQLLLRTMDRGEALYDSMCLRGYRGELQYCTAGKKETVPIWSILITVLFFALFILLRQVPVVRLLG